MDLDASKEVGLEIKAEKTKHMFMSYHQKEWQNHNSWFLWKCSTWEQQ